MSTILVTGGSGMLGSTLVGTLIQRGYEVRAAGRHVSSSNLPAGARAVRADVASGDGLSAALDGVDVVLHAASSPSSETQVVDVQGTRRMVVAAAEAGVSHLLYVSIAGVDEISYSYYRAKFAAEQVVATDRVPWTVQRLTQFHPFVGYLLERVTAGPLTTAPARIPLQPIDLTDAATCLADDVEAGPTGWARDRGGPRVEQVAELAEQWRSARKSGGRVLAVPVPGPLGRKLRDGAATCPGGRSTGAGFAEWLARSG